MCRKEGTGSAFPCPRKPTKTNNRSFQEQRSCTACHASDMQVAADCGVRFEIGWTKAQFKQAIIEAMNDNSA